MRWQGIHARLSTVYGLLGIIAVIATTAYALEKYSERIGVLPALAIGISLPVVALALVYTLTLLFLAQRRRAQRQRPSDE